MPQFLIPDADPDSPLLENQQELAKRYGIEQFDYPHPDAQIRSIGFAPKTQTWYGWSHRAVNGFKVGSVVKKGDVIADGTAAEMRPQRRFPVGFTAKTLDDAKAMASAFSNEVS